MEKNIKDYDMEKKKKIAHRGYSAVYGDNNLKSFTKAIENNFDMLELDLRLNKNNTIIVYHDLFYKNHFIKDLSDTDIKKFNILTLEDFFKNINIKNTKIILDLKDNNQKLIKELLIFFDKFNINTKNIIVASFNINYLKLLQNKNLNLGYITCNNYFNYNFNKLLKDVDYILVDYNMINKDIINVLKKYDKTIYCFTCNDKNTLKFLNKFNIDGIISNIKID